MAGGPDGPAEGNSGNSSSSGGGKGGGGISRSHKDYGQFGRAISNAKANAEIASAHADKVAARQQFIQDRIQQNRNRVRGLQVERGLDKYGAKDFFAGALENIAKALTLGFVDPELNGKDFSFSKGHPVARERGLHANPLAGLANLAAGPVGAAAVSAAQDYAGTTPGAYGPNGEVNSMASLFGNNTPSSKQANGSQVANSLRGSSEADRMNIVRALGG